VWGRPAPQAVGGAGWSPSRTSESPLHGAIRVLGGQIFVACGGSDALRLEFVQLEGRKRVTAQEFANGARLATGDWFDG
jgi:methionyl-tRNA formyltransferase